jgi:hypothetical protein
MEKQIREIIAHHVGGTYEAKQKCAEEILRLFSVVGQSEQLCPDCGNTGRRLPQTLDSPDGLECECGSGT